MSSILDARLIDQSVSDCIRHFAALPLHGAVDRFTLQCNPFRRPVRPQDFQGRDFATPLPASAFVSISALCAQRLLTIIYEQDLLFLPSENFQRVRRDFERFYADDVRLAGESIRPTLEHHVFSFLDTEIDVAGPWTREAMTAFFDSRLAAAESAESVVAATVLGAGDPVAAAEQFLVQLSSDFLTEASAMARNTLGNWGAPQSALFKVLIDEYGNGVHDVKHSTLFEKTLASVSLATGPHEYWQFFLPSSLSLLNYFHYISRNHLNIFKYAGAVYYTEATLASANRVQSRMLKQVFGDSVDTAYFDEHGHIDVYHGRMVVNELILPLLDRCGDTIIPDIIRGFEAFRLLQDLADADLAAQIAWGDRLAAHRDEGSAMLCAPPPVEARFVEPAGELSVPHVHDEDELLSVEAGALELVAGPTSRLRLTAGEAIVIPAGRLHGSVVLSPECTYAIHPLRTG